MKALEGIYFTKYRNNPKFSDRYAWANSADPDQTAPIRVYTVCHSVSIVWTHYSMVEPHSSNFRVITTNILGVRIFRKFMVCTINHYLLRAVVGKGLSKNPVNCQKIFFSIKLLHNHLHYVCNISAKCWKDPVKALRRECTINHYLLGAIVGKWLS